MKEWQPCYWYCVHVHACSLYAICAWAMVESVEIRVPRTIAAHDPACNARLVQVWSRNRAQNRLLSVLRMVVVLQATSSADRFQSKAIRTEVGLDWFARLARLK